HRVDPTRPPAGGTGARPPPVELCLGADRDQESAAGPAEPAQPAAHLEQTRGDDPRVQRLRTIPGIGPFTAILLILELGEIQRFPSAKHLASYVGLTPRVRASANRVRLGHISKEGNRLLRWALVVAATQAARRPRPLRALLGAAPESRSPPRPLARLVPGRPTTQGHEDRPRGPGPTLGGDRLSD